MTTRLKIQNRDLAATHRPQDFDDVVGQDEAVRNLRASLKKRILAHGILLSGPSGVGKTTVARLIGKELGVPPLYTVEVNAACYSGIDAMRDLARTSQYRFIGKNPTRFIIIDECHALTKPAWQALLTVLEEPPPYVYWVLCTTEPAKLPTTIMTRVHHYPLSNVDWQIIAGLLVDIVVAEGIDANERVIERCARQSGGSVRQAINLLGASLATARC